MKVLTNYSYNIIKNGRQNFHRKFCQKTENLHKTTPIKGKWKPTIGLEIHAQIMTKSKLFSPAPIDFTRPPNSCIALFDCAIPGTMPVLNKKCVESGVRTALALSCQLNESSIFERKHYFYSDLPAGFQITQQRKPLAIDGKIEFNVWRPGIKFYNKTSKIKQIQLEQDSGKSLHCEDTQKSLIDLNRAGIPLMEFVFEPDLSDGEEAAALVKELILILQMLGTCSCKMEEGALRVDANVSVSQNDKTLGTRTELKNIGSIKGVAGAIKSEIDRQISILEKGGSIVNETRAWDAPSKKTIPMREKEERQDYRFMPENNLPFLRLHINENQENTKDLVDAVALSKTLPTLPNEIRQNLKEKYNLLVDKVIIISADLDILRLFNNLMEENPNRNPTLVANLMINEVLTVMNSNDLDTGFYAKNERIIGDLVDLLQSNAVNLITVKKVLQMSVTDSELIPKKIVEENDWYLINDEKELEEICLDVMRRNEKMVRQYRAGKKKVFKALMGQVIKTTNERAQMKIAAEIMQRLLDTPETP